MILFNKSLNRVVFTIIALIPFLFFSHFVQAAGELSSVNLRPGVTEISRSIFGLHVFVFWVCVGIGVVVYGIMLWSLIRYRRSRRARAASFSHSTKMEVIWTTIPVIILVVMLVPSIKVLYEMYDTSESELDILVTGYQWKWKYQYLDQDITFFSNLATKPEAIYGNGEKSENYLLEVDNELVLPIDKKVRFLVTSNDVVHSWWVPDFAVKRDAIPGYINEAWTVVEQLGVYRGQCAELCGKNHAYMPIVVRAVTNSEFDQWVASKTSESKGDAEVKDIDPKELLAQGEQIYNTRCAACHQPSGQGNPPVFPALAGNSLVTAADPTEVINVVYFGRKGTAMQAFGEQMKLNEVAAVISYIRNGWSNASPVVQPTRVASQTSN